MRQVRITLKDPAKGESFHVVRMPDYHEKGWYVQGISIDSFRSRELKRAFPVLDGSVNWMDYAKMVKYCSVEYPPFRDDIYLLFDVDKAIYHDCLWNFYTYIGYDRPRKRYAD